jgi:hypothetical protein
LFDQDGAETFIYGGLTRRAGTSEWVEDDAVWRRHQPAQIAHETDRLDRGVLAAVAFGFRCFGAIKEPSGSAGIAMIAQRTFD